MTTRWPSTSTIPSPERECSHVADTPPPVSRAQSSCTGLPVTGRAPRAAMVMDGHGLTGRAEEARMTVRSGTAEWHGDVESGSGTVTVGDSVFEGAYSYDSRFGEGKGTNPEQLIAAAHASCFTMALSNVLSAAGHPPESLRSDARSSSPGSPASTGRPSWAGHACASAASRPKPGRRQRWR